MKKKQGQIESTGLVKQQQQITILKCCCQGKKKKYKQDKEKGLTKSRCREHKNKQTIKIFNCNSIANTLADLQRRDKKKRYCIGSEELGFRKTSDLKRKQN